MSDRQNCLKTQKFLKLFQEFLTIVGKNYTKTSKNWYYDRIFKMVQIRSKCGKKGLKYLSKKNLLTPLNN